MEMVASWWRKNGGKGRREMEKVQVSYCGNRYCLLVNFPHQIAEKPYFKEILTTVEGVKGYMVKFKDLPFLSRILNDEKLSLGSLPSESKEIFQEIASSKSIAKRIIDTVGPWRLRPHQMSAIDFFYRHGGRIILADGWNMGKTVTTLAIMLSSLTKLFLVVCDAVLIYHWKKHMIESGFWKEEDIITEPKQENIAVGCAIITYDVFLAKRFKFQRLRFVVLDEPRTEISCQQLIKNIEYLVILSRKGDRKFHELLPMVLPKVKTSFLKQRYRIDEDGPKAHCEELKAIKAHFLFGEEIVKMKKTPTPFKAVYLQPQCNSFLRQIVSYLRYGMSRHQQEYTIYCRDEKSKHFLAILLADSLSKEQISLIKCKDSKEITQETTMHSTVIFTQPFNLQEQQQLNRIIKYLQANNCKVQYFPYPHQGEPSLYPETHNFQQYLETPSKPLVSYKPTSHDKSNKKKIIVYYDCQQSEEQASLIQEEIVQDNYSKERLCFNGGCFSMDMQIFICQKNDNPEKEKENKQDSLKKDIDKGENIIDLNEDLQQVTAPTQQHHQQLQTIDIPTNKQPLRPLKYKHKQRSVIKIRLHPLTSIFP